MAPDQAKLDEFVGKILNDMGAAATGAMVLIGDKLGLYKALAAGSPLTPAELAARTGPAERYIREWLAAQAAAGYVQYRPATGTYAMTTEQALVLADAASPALMAGGFEVFASMFKDEQRTFDLLPVLADALEEAGCENPDLLGHLRQSGAHLGSCFILDALLGRT